VFWVEIKYVRILRGNAKEAMQERLRRKAKLQKSMSSPKNYGDSFKNEMYKQKELKSQSKEERRNAMCEELGRGC
jgi:hypothetical protein